MAFLLSLNPWKVQISQYTYQQLQGRRLLEDATESAVGQEDPRMSDLEEIGLTAPNSARRQLQNQVIAKSQVTFTILPDPTTEVYPPPVQLAQWLSTARRQSMMVAAFPNFDTNYVIKPIEFVPYQVTYSTKAIVLNVSYNQANLSVSLDNYGYAYALAVPKDQDLGPPSSYQVSQGLSFQNIPLPSGAVAITQKFSAFNMTIDYLDPDTSYNVYLTAGSAHPGYPDLMNTSLIQRLQFTTLQAPPSKFFFIIL